MIKKIEILLITLFLLLAPIKVYATQLGEEVDEEMLLEEEDEEEDEEYEEGKEEYTPPKEEEEFEILDGEYNDTGKATIKEGHGYVTFVGHVNADISENIYIEFWNLSDYEVYRYYLYKINKYRTSVELPPGTYMIMEGGVFYDTKAQYPIENVQFVVESNKATQVDFGVGMDKNQAGNYIEEENYIDITVENDDGTKDIYTDDGNTYVKHIDNQNNEVQINPIQSVSTNDIMLKSKSMSLKSVLVTFFSIIIAGMIALIIYVKKENE